jgi:hypothetical protein
MTKFALNRRDGLIKIQFRTYFLGTGQVEIPKIAYRGQKLMMLVRVKTAERIRKTIPRVPLTTFVK